MCFGPIASFTASAFLASMGTVIFKNIKSRKEILFAVFPALFAVQQFIEGLLWVALKKGGSDAFAYTLSITYLLFAYGLWPILCPISVYAIEYDPRRRKILKVFIFLGLVTSLYLIFFIFKNPVYSLVVNCSIRYKTFVMSAEWFTSLYLIVTLCPYFLSSQKAILIFGLPNVFFCIIAFFVYDKTFISVWCFFAAVISANLYFFLRKLHHEPLLPISISLPIKIQGF